MTVATAAADAPARAGSEARLRLFVAIPTIGRPDCVRQVVGRLGRQTLPVDGIVVVGVSRADVAGVADAAGLPVEVATWDKGLTRQRNRAIDLIGNRADIILFIDDDFVPADTYAAELVAAFARDPGLCGVTGRVIADGVRTGGLDFDEAIAILDADTPPAELVVEPRRGLYGCNMAYRRTAMAGLRFDERLPLYGWQEDVDFAGQVARRGKVVRMNSMAGVHMGNKGARQAGQRMGYSQIANPVYLLRKRTIRPGLAYRIMGRNILSNLARSLRPEAWIDRRGRVIGNWRAIADLMLGRIDPERILDL